MKTSKLQFIKLSDIAVGPNNPRKTFDSESMLELTKSVSLNGVIQPILVRPKGKAFELVCGERRLKASIAAELKEIPANVRDLTDDEAFELQIIENLERKDVHPLEEALAFGRMIESGRYTVEDIAEKLAKSESLITKRLKLNGLIAPIKKDFAADKFGVAAAMKIARLCSADQKQLLEGFKGHWNGYGTEKDIDNRIARHTRTLSSASFDTTDEKLVKKAGACTGCPKRSGANTLLFDDIKEKDRCFDGGCFAKKLSADIEARMRKAIEGGKIHFAGESYQKRPEIVDKLLKDYKLTLLASYSDFRADGKGKDKVLWVTGDKMGKVQRVNLTKTKATAASSSPEEVSNADQIDKIKARVKRAVELDHEKVFKILKADIIPKAESLTHSGTFEKAPLDMAGVVLACYCGGNYTFRGWLKKVVTQTDNDYRLRDTYDQLVEIITPPLFNKILRKFAVTQLLNEHGDDRSTFGNAQALYQLIMEYESALVIPIQEEQDKAAKKRAERVKKQLEALTKKTKK